MVAGAGGFVVTIPRINRCDEFAYGAVCQIIGEVGTKRVFTVVGLVLADIDITQNNVCRIKQLCGCRTKCGILRNGKGQRPPTQIVDEWDGVVVSATSIQRSVGIDEIERGIEARRRGIRCRR